MKWTAVVAAGLCSIILAGCETSDRGDRRPYGAVINEGRVDRDVVIIDQRRPDYRDDRGYDRRDDGRRGPYSSVDRRDRYDRDRRYGDRDDCRGRPGYDPRYDRCDR